MQFPCPATQRKSSSLKSTYTVCEDSFANLKASLAGKWAVRTISRDRRADRQHFYTPRYPAGVGRHTQTRQPPAALLRPLGAAGCGTTRYLAEAGERGWLQSSPAPRLGSKSNPWLPHSLAEASGHTQTSHLPSAALRPACACSQGIFPLPR